MQQNLIGSERSMISFYRQTFLVSRYLFFFLPLTERTPHDATFAYHKYIKFNSRSYSGSNHCEGFLSFSLLLEHVTAFSWLASKPFIVYLFFESGA